MECILLSLTGQEELSISLRGVHERKAIFMFYRKKWMLELFYSQNDPVYLYFNCVTPNKSNSVRVIWYWIQQLLIPKQEISVCVWSLWDLLHCFEWVVLLGHSIALSPVAWPFLFKSTCTDTWYALTELTLPYSHLCTWHCLCFEGINGNHLPIPITDQH